MHAKRYLVLLVALSLYTSVLQAYNLSDYMHRVGKKTLSLQHLCMYGTIYPYVLDYMHQQVEDAIIWQKGSVYVSRHDLCDMCVSVLLEICYVTLCGMHDNQVQEHLVLTIYGALLHKCLQQIITACGLDDCVSNETKQCYHLYGSNYVKALLACVCSQYIDPTKYQ